MRWFSGKLVVLIGAVLAIGCAAVRAEDAGGKRYVIIHADDAGMSHSVNRATIDAMEKGIVSSASIMVPCAWFPEFAEYARNHPEKDYGIHLTLNSEWGNYRWGPAAPREQVPSLLDKDGYLWSGSKEVAANAKAQEVEIELRAQIDRAIEFGVPLSHLDTHMGSLFVRPDLAQIYVRLGVEYNLPVLFLRPEENFFLFVAYPALLDVAKEITGILDREHFPILRSVFQYYEKGDHEKRKEVYLDRLKKLQPGVTEIIIHCGYDNEELQGITSSHELRDSDRRIFTDPAVMAAIADDGIEVITWGQFFKMAQQKAPAEAVGQ